MIKIFLCISQEEQKKRFDKLLARKETAWRVSKKDLKRNREFKKYKRMNEEMLQKPIQTMHRGQSWKRQTEDLQQ